MKNLNSFKTLLLVLLITLLLSCKKSSTNPNDIILNTSEDENISSLTSIDTTILSKKLIAYYPFKGDLLDYSGNGHNGTAIGTAYYGNNHLGKSNSALILGSARIVTDNFFNFQRDSKFAISVWFTMNANSDAGRLISTECPEGNFRMGAYSNGIYAFQFEEFYVYDTVSLGTWNYLVYVYNKRNIKLYKNGFLKYSGYDTGNESLNYCAPFTIGAKASSAYDLWQGSIENLRIYDRVLSKAEVKYLYKH